MNRLRGGGSHMLERNVSLFFKGDSCSFLLYPLRTRYM